MTSIDLVKLQLATDFPGTTVSGGEEADGFWLRAERNDGQWVWERRRMVSLEFAFEVASKELA